MVDQTNVVGLEIIVHRLSDAVDVFTEAFGWTVVFSGRSAEVAGDVVVLDAGTITVTVLCPDDHGPGMLSDREPRVSQIVVGGDAEAVAGATDRLVRLGLPTQSHGPTRRYVPPEAAAGVLGFEAALSLHLVEPDVGNTSDQHST